MHHDLKIWPQYFCRVEDGSKTFEVRENDRGFQPGDTVLLREYNPATRLVVDEDPMGRESSWEETIGYTGKQLKFRIGYVLPLTENKVVFSLLPQSNALQPKSREE